MVAVAVTDLNVDTVGTDLIAVSGTQLTTGQALSITAPKRTEDLLFVAYFTTSSTITFTAGTQPGSARAAGGDTE
jgi:hypothetical protein